jgi:hypothetical protein
MKKKLSPTALLALEKMHPNNILVTCTSVGNPDFRQDPDRPISPPFIKTVANYAEASALCVAYITHHDLGGGNWSGGQVYNKEEMQVAYVSYNGRVWECDPPRGPNIIDISVQIEISDSDFNLFLGLYRDLFNTNL